jgi:hypothetical protein
LNARHHDWNFCSVGRQWGSQRLLVGGSAGPLVAVSQI